MRVHTHTDSASGQATLERHETRSQLMTAIAPTNNAIRQNVSGPSRPTRLLLVDDHAAVRAGLRDMLADEPDFDVVAAVATAEQGLAVAERELIDLAVIDYQLGRRTGLWLSRKLKRLRQPPRVVIYSAYADDLLSAAAVVAEADGVVSKAGLGSELRDAIRTVARGGHRLRRVPPWLAEGLRDRLGNEEQAIFGLLLAAIPRDEVAETLGMSTDALDARLWAMLRALESPRREARAETVVRHVAGHRVDRLDRRGE
jgi:DNA-binding NarL/FixJ family response regulator